MKKFSYPGRVPFVEDMSVIQGALRKVSVPIGINGTMKGLDFLGYKEMFDVEEILQAIQSSDDTVIPETHKVVAVQPIEEMAESESHITILNDQNSVPESTLTLPRCTMPRKEQSMDDVPKIDAGVRMLCMDGGGAKGVIEATILDKIFCSVAVTLKYEVHVMNWITLVIDKSQVKTKELDFIYKAIVGCINMPETSVAGYLKNAKQFKQVQAIDRTKDFSDKRGCIVISGLITDSGFFKPLTNQQKCKVLKDETIRKIPGLEIKDFLHGASKYWVFLNSDQTDEARNQIIEDVLPAFSHEKDKTKCIKMLIPAVDLVLKKSQENTKVFDGRDLLVFYWDNPVKTKHALALKDKLMGKTTDEDYPIKYRPELFFEEIRADEMFDLMIGTSTGSILAFGMGYKGLSPQECRDVYLKSIGRIFSSKYDRSTTGMIGLADSVFRTVGDLVGQGHYSIDGVKDTLEENYNLGRSSRTLMGGGENRTSCICACVALNWDEQNLEVFDTHNPKYKDWDLIQFLTASSDAPVYFTTPYEVKGPRDSDEPTKFIDGGLGANCPAKQGIDLAKRRWKGSNIELVLSIGAGKDKHPPPVPKAGGDWLKTLCSMVTDGDSIWQNLVLPMLSIDEACKHTEHLRIQPKMELAQFKADSTKVIDMCNLAEAWLSTDVGFSQVTEACGKIIAKSMKLSVESRILTERDLLDWIASTLPIGKNLFQKKFKRQSYVDNNDTLGQGITNDSLDMKFGRELHSLYVTPCNKLKSRFPAVDQNFLYIPRPVSVGETDLRFTLKFDHHSERDYIEGLGQKVLKLHCPDNHEVHIIANIDVFETDNVYRISGLDTVPLTETEQFHRLVHEASKEISQLLEEDRSKAEEKLLRAMELDHLPDIANLKQKYIAEHFMRIQAYFYLWKRNTKEVNLSTLNETLIQVGMKKRPWPKIGKLGEPDVTVRTVIPAPPENMMFGIAVEYFNDKYDKAVESGKKDEQARYTEYMKHLGVHPALKQLGATNFNFKKKFLKTVFRNKKDPRVPGRSKNTQDITSLRYKAKVKREVKATDSMGRETLKNHNKSMFGRSIFGRNKKDTPIPNKFVGRCRGRPGNYESDTNNSEQALG